MSVCSNRRFLAAVALLCVAVPVHAETLKVPSDEFPDIQSALTAAVSGDIVQVKKGVYNENLTIANAGVTLKGGGATINGNYVNSCITVTAADVVVDSLVLVNGGLTPVVEGDPAGGLFATSTAANITLNKLTVEGCQSFGILLDDTFGTITGCKVTGCGGPGIDVQTGNSGLQTLTVISKNTVTACTDGIQANDGPFDIDKNTIDLCSSDGIDVLISLVPAEGISALLTTTVTNNKINNCSEVALELDQENEIGGTILVEKNNIQECFEGINLGGFFFDVMSNTVNESVTVGLQASVRDSHFEKNKITNSGGPGFLLGGIIPVLEGGPVFVGDNDVVSNTISGSKADGLVVFSTLNLLEKNTVKDNGGDGIEIELGADDCTLDGNKVQNNAHDGIDNSAATQLITNNQCKGNFGNDLAGKGDGLGTVTEFANSTGNKVGDDSDLSTFSTEGELDMP